MKCFEGFPRMLCWKALHVNTALDQMKTYKGLLKHPHIIDSRHINPESKLTTEDTNLSWVFVNSYVNDSIILAAFLQYGFLNGKVPVFPLFPVKYNNINSLIVQSKCVYQFKDPFEGSLQTHIIGSNMLRIFKHGVKLFGGEFLRSNGKAARNNKLIQIHEGTNWSFWSLIWKLACLTAHHVCHAYLNKWSKCYLCLATLWRACWTFYQVTLRVEATSTPWNLRHQFSGFLYECETHWLRGTQQPCPILSSSFFCENDKQIYFFLDFGIWK